MHTNLLLTGRPGIGKSTLIRAVIDSGEFPLAGGFFTEEIQEKGHRVGFTIRGLDGQEDVLAHVRSDSPYRVGKYGVNVGAFEQTGVPALEAAIDSEGLIVVDEIGRMELFSKNFQDAVIAALDAPLAVLGVIQRRSNPILDQIRNREDTQVIEVTLDNRNQLFNSITELLRGCSPPVPLSQASSAKPK